MGNFMGRTRLVQDLCTVALSTRECCGVSAFSCLANRAFVDFVSRRHCLHMCTYMYMYMYIHFTIYNVHVYTHLVA